MPRDNFKGHPRRKARRERAALRQLARDSLTTNQQLDVIAKRRGESKRELKRLVRTQIDQDQSVVQDRPDEWFTVKGRPVKRRS